MMHKFLRPTYILLAFFSFTVLKASGPDNDRKIWTISDEADFELRLRLDEVDDLRMIIHSEGGFGDCLGTLVLTDAGIEVARQDIYEGKVEGEYLEVSRQMRALLKEAKGADNYKVHLFCGEDRVDFFPLTLDPALATSDDGRDGDGATDGNLFSTELWPCDKVDLGFLDDYRCSDNRLSPTNFFGESGQVFGKNKIVYVLDYQPIMDNTLFKATTKGERLARNRDDFEEENKEVVFPAEHVSPYVVRPLDASNVEHIFYKIYRSSTGLPLLKSEQLLGKWAIPGTQDFLMISLPSMGAEKLFGKNDVQFKIHNINRFRYNVVIGTDQVVFKSEPGKLFSEYLSGNSGTLDGLIDQVGPKSSAATAKGSTKLVQSGALDNFQSNVICFRNKWATLQAYLNKVYNQDRLFACHDEEKMDEALLGLGNLLGKINTDLDLLLIDVRKKQKELEPLKSVCRVLKELGDEEKKKNALEAEIAQLKKDKKDSKKKEEELVELNKSIKAKKAATKGKTCEDQKISGLESEIKPFDQLIYLRSKMPSASEFKRLSMQFNAMNEYANQYTKTIPNLRSNKLKLNFHIKERDTVRKVDASVSDSIVGNSRAVMPIDSVSIPIIKRWHVSFSNGAFMGLGENLRPERYGYRPLPGSNGVGGTPDSYELVSSGNAELPLGFAALLNLQYQATVGMAIGPSFGVGLSLQDNPRPAYLAGLSVMFGEETQFGISGGVLFTKVDEFNNLRYQGVTYQNTSLPIEYNKVLRQGWFLSLTYTIFTEIKR